MVNPENKFEYGSGETGESSGGALSRLGARSAAEIAAERVDSLASDTTDGVMYRQLVAQLSNPEVTESDAQFSGEDEVIYSGRNYQLRRHAGALVVEKFVS